MRRFCWEMASRKRCGLWEGFESTCVLAGIVAGRGGYVTVLPASAQPYSAGWPRDRAELALSHALRPALRPALRNEGNEGNEGAAPSTAPR